MKKFWINILCLFIPLARMRHKLKKDSENTVKYCTVLVVDNGKERAPSRKELRHFKVKGKGQKNIIKIVAPIHEGLQCCITYSNGSSHNMTMIHQAVSGLFYISNHESYNLVEIGAQTTACSVVITLIGNTVKIGQDCMFSNNIRIWGDGHSVLDLKTKECLNKPSKPILVGDHCWIGERVTLTKNAQIPNDNIVGIAAVVTKKFMEEHCVLGGAPAKVVKTGVSWHRASPLTYEKTTKEMRV